MEKSRQHSIEEIPFFKTERPYQVDFVHFEMRWIFENKNMFFSPILLK